MKYQKFSLPNSKLRLQSKPDRNQSKLSDNHNYLHNNNYNHNLYYNHYNYYHNLYNHNLYYNDRFVPSIGNNKKWADRDCFWQYIKFL